MSLAEIFSTAYAKLKVIVRQMFSALVQCVIFLFLCLGWTR